MIPGPGPSSEHDTGPAQDAAREPAEAPRRGRTFEDMILAHHPEWEYLVSVVPARPPLPRRSPLHADSAPQPDIASVPS
jgi:hypothetical protein